MRVKATYEHLFQVTREVEIDDDDLTAWVERERERGNVYSPEDAALRYLNLEDTEFHAEVFRDWRTSETLPNDFELQWSDVAEVEVVAEGVPTNHKEAGS